MSTIFVPKAKGLKYCTLILSQNTISTLPVAHSYKISTFYNFIGCAEQFRVTHHSMSTIWAKFEGSSQQVVQCTFNIVSSKCLVPKLVSFNLDTIFDLSAHRSLVPAPTYLSLSQIMSNYVYIYCNTCISRTQVFTKITNL